MLNVSDLLNNYMEGPLSLRENMLITEKSLILLCSKIYLATCQVTILSAELYGYSTVDGSSSCSIVNCLYQLTLHLKYFNNEKII